MIEAVVMAGGAEKKGCVPRTSRRTDCQDLFDSLWREREGGVGMAFRFLLG